MKRTSMEHFVLVIQRKGVTFREYKGPTDLFLNGLAAFIDGKKIAEMFVTRMQQKEFWITE